MTGRERFEHQEGEEEEEDKYEKAMLAWDVLPFPPCREFGGKFPSLS